jgi:hypothetical protein
MPLDYLPRDLFLGEVFRRIPGADRARAAVVAEIEDAQFTFLPGDTLLGPNAVKVQPDGYLATPFTLVLMEAKRIRRSSFGCRLHRLGIDLDQDDIKPCTGCDFRDA